jgi:hypothetical protein
VLLVVDSAKDAADEALLEEARRLAAVGHHRFVVASADGAFGQLADLGQLEIILWQTQEPRKNAYTDRAARIHRVALPHNGTSKKAGASPPQKALAVLSRSTPAKATSVKATPAIVTPAEVTPRP